MGSGCSSGGIRVTDPAGRGPTQVEVKPDPQVETTGDVRAVIVSTLDPQWCALSTAPSAALLALAKEQVRSLVTLSVVP